MRKTILLVAVVFLCATAPTLAQVPAEKQLTGVLDLTYMTSKIWRGFDYYADDHGAFDASVDLNLYGTGFGLNVLWSQAVGGEKVNSETIAGTLYYTGSTYEGETYATNYKVGWVYYRYPNEPRSGSTHASAQAADMQELFAKLSWPDICPAGIVPSYTLLTMWPSEGNSQARKNSGWAHIFGLGYDLSVTGLLPDVPEQIMHLSAEIVYNDGVAPGVVIGSASGTVEHDWSHVIFGASTDFDIGNNMTLTPGVFYQCSMEDTVNTEDEYGATVSVKYPF
jgi:hypothetical protein